MKDIVKDESLTSLTKLPPLRTIYVLGTGPNGVPEYHRIPKNATVIGVNKAIMLHGAPHKKQSHNIHERMAQSMGTKASDYKKSIPMWLWLCSDTGLPEEEWFLYHMNLLIRCDFSISDRSNPTVVVGTSPDEGKSLHKRFPGAAYKATYGLNLKKTPAYKLLWPGLRGGASVGAQAVQLAYFFGANRIILCGIDMYGDGYYDKTKNKCETMLREDGKSRHLPLFNGLCRAIEEEGKEVVSISETALDVHKI